MFNLILLLIFASVFTSTGIASPLVRTFPKGSAASAASKAAPAKAAASNAAPSKAAPSKASASKAPPSPMNATAPASTHAPRPLLNSTAPAPPAAKGNATAPAAKGPKGKADPQALAAAACVPPNIRVTVDNTQFSVPLFTDCTYQKSVLLTPGQNGSPSSATSSVADYTQYVDSNGAALDKNSLNSFLAFFGDAVDTDVLLAASACGITDTNGNVDTIQEESEQLDGGNSINVSNYQCIVQIS